jgi:hypothetical protein
MASAQPHRNTPDENRLLSGKRRARRHRRALHVRCAGPSGSVYIARTHDISRRGLLLEITDPDFLPDGKPDLFPFAARVAEEFPAGMDVSFGDGVVQVRVRVVRIQVKPGTPLRMFLGCEFQPLLSYSDCNLLEVSTGGDETRAPSSIPVDRGTKKSSR